MLVCTDSHKEWLQTADLEIAQVWEPEKYSQIASNSELAIPLPNGLRSRSVPAGIATLGNEECPPSARSLQTSRQEKAVDSGQDRRHDGHVQFRIPEQKRRVFAYTPQRHQRMFETA